MAKQPSARTAPRLTAMRSLALSALLALACHALAGAPKPAASKIVWESLPPLPPAAEGQSQIGVAGPFAGVHNDALIVAGGANFPEGLPWETRPDGTSPPKVYHRDIFVLTKDGDDYQWQVADTKLPNALGYGVSVSTPEGVVCAGGEWKDPPDAEGKQTLHRSDRVFVLTWDPAAKTVAIDDSLAPLPRPATAQAGALIEDTLYLACGDTGEGPSSVLWSLDLVKGQQWKELPPCPGLPRVLPIAAAQHDGHEDCFFLFSGRRPGPDATDYLTDAWRYNPKEGAWRQVADIAPGGQKRCVMAGTGTAWDASHVLVFGGADGRLFQRLAHELPARVAEARAAGDAAEVDRLEQEKLGILTNHPGFSRDVLAYDAITDTWAKVGEIEGHSPVTTSAVKWGGAIVLPSGEISPGIRTTQILKAVPQR